QVDLPALALAASSAVIEQHVVTRRVEKSCPGQHLGAGALEAMDEDDGWCGGRTEGKPSGKQYAVTCGEVHHFGGNADACGGGYAALSQIGEKCEGTNAGNKRPEQYDDCQHYDRRAAHGEVQAQASRKCRPYVLLNQGTISLVCVTCSTDIQ